MKQYNKLYEENAALKLEIDAWKNKYEALKKQYMGLLKKQLERSQILTLQKNNSRFQQQFDDFDVDSQESVEGETIIYQEDEQESNIKVEFAQKVFQVFFVLEKSTKDQGCQISWQFPKHCSHLKSLMKRLETFIFPHGIKTQPIDDDSEESRKNQIIFGTLGQELVFPLENESLEDPIKILAALNPKNKYFAYVLSKPNLLSQSNVLIQSEMAFCAITKFPFRQFFFEYLIRFVQQQLKMCFFQQTTSVIKKHQQYRDSQRMLEQIYKLNVYQYPVQKEWSSDISEIRLEVESEKVVLKDQHEFCKRYVKSMPPQGLSRLIHFFMLEKHILFYCSDKKLLNDMFQFLRIIIRPLHWHFPIIYTMNEQLLPLLDSPIPILVGFCCNKEELQKKKLNLDIFVVLDVKYMQWSGCQQDVKQLQSSVQLFAESMEKQPIYKVQIIEKFIKSKIQLIRTGHHSTYFEQRLLESQMITQYFQK